MTYWRKPVLLIHWGRLFFSGQFLPFQDFFWVRRTDLMAFLVHLGNLLGCWDLLFLLLNTRFMLFLSFGFFVECCLEEKKIKRVKQKTHGTSLLLCLSNNNQPGHLHLKMVTSLTHEKIHSSWYQSELVIEKRSTQSWINKKINSHWCQNKWNIAWEKDARALCSYVF